MCEGLLGFRIKMKYTKTAATITPLSKIGTRLSVPMIVMFERKDFLCFIINQILSEISKPNY